MSIIEPINIQILQQVVTRRLFACMGTTCFGTWDVPLRVAAPHTEWHHVNTESSLRGSQIIGLFWSCGLLLA